MPFAFPSHQGLIAPLWRRWPTLFDIPGLFIGAAMPDVIDGILGVYRGHLGQGWGHSIIALPLLCVPGGLVLWWLALFVVRFLPYSKRHGFLARVWNAGLESIHVSAALGARGGRMAITISSIGLGVLSHLLFDLISHGGFVWFYPWMPKVKIFPTWWYVTWLEVPVPGYKEPYPIGPHFLMWIFLGILGILLLFYPFIGGVSGQKRGSPDNKESQTTPDFSKEDR